MIYNKIIAMIEGHKNTCLSTPLWVFYTLNLIEEFARRVRLRYVLPTAWQQVHGVTYDANC